MPKRVPAQIRRAEQRDAARVVEMSHAVSVHEGSSTPKLDEATFLAFGFGSDRIFDCYVAECEPSLVGHICVTQGFDFLEGCPVLWIADLYVEQRSRHRGIARSLIAFAARRAPASTSLFLQWMVAPNNTSAKDFYLAIGARFDAGQAMFLAPKQLAALVSDNG